MKNPVYGYSETNPIKAGYKAPDGPAVEWTDKRLAKITRLRLISDVGFPNWDVSYCHGELHDGTRVDVVLPFLQLPKSRYGKGGIQKAIIFWAKKEKVFAKGLGIFDSISCLQ